jgi:hypothetical protein
MGMLDVTMLVDAINHIGSSLEWKEWRSQVRNELLKPALIAFRVAFFH